MKLSYLAGCQSIQAHLEDAPCKNKSLDDGVPVPPAQL